MHPEGNYVAASPETPFLQLGEFKYGKPILSRIANSALSLNDAARRASALFRQMSGDWDNAMHTAFGRLPHFPREI